MNSRILGLDVSRAFAVFGMVLVNYQLVMGADEGSAWLLKLVHSIEGRAVALFIVLAGVGVSLKIQALTLHHDHNLVRNYQRQLIKRAMLLFVFGVVFSFVWPADILRFYGMYFFIASVIAVYSSRALISLGVLSILAFVLGVMLFDYEAGWDFSTLTYQDFWTLHGATRYLLFNGFHPVFPWVAFFIAGMWLARQNLLNSYSRIRLMIKSLFFWLAIESLSRLLVGWVTKSGLDPTGEWISLCLTKPMPPSPLYVFAATAFAIFFICAIISLIKSIEHWVGVKLLAKTGQLSLSLYILHVMIGMAVIEGLGLMDGQSIEVAVSAALIYCVFAVIFSCCWLTFFRGGPFETLFNRLIRWELPFNKKYSVAKSQKTATIQR
ncbi:DUF418 domain-containing protein [Teredinibacter sp. KSP-S5-2]|uniref:DUF418 domain-containing protein n=1 Tax=Teredinibacter sp. KSP-S5-2 TaxID=3034506 RepID=UPI002934C807|nr:DUF418 domain-containing protein [Teredinibacter sp. KSP-S5-2]WNO10235.1 DUF418 domain-containing protein [Teredinibacter sp. KSP-S5-2]